MYTSVPFFSHIVFFCAQFCEKHNYPTNPLSLSKEKILLMPVRMHLSPMLHTAPGSHKQTVCILEIPPKILCLASVCVFGLDAVRVLDWKLDNDIMSET